MLADPVPDLPRGAVILHLAGVTRGDETALRQNLAMIPALARAAQAASARSILFASTAGVYAPGPDPAGEEDAPAPPGAYGRAKLLAEQALRDRAHCPVHVLRIGNVAGADALLGPRPAQSPIVLDPVPGRDGGPLRSWIGPRDLAAALAALCRADLPPVLNLAQDPPLAMADLLDASHLPWTYGPPRAG